MLKYLIFSLILLDLFINLLKMSISQIYQIASVAGFLNILYLQYIFFNFSTRSNPSRFFVFIQTCSKPVNFKNDFDCHMKMEHLHSTCLKLYSQQSIVVSRIYYQTCSKPINSKNDFNCHMKMEHLLATIHRGFSCLLSNL